MAKRNSDQPLSSGRERRKRVSLNDIFRKFAHTVSELAGSVHAFAIAFFIILVWAVTGPLFGFSDTWQLVINTGTTIVTFLMVFLIQNTQNRDNRTVQAKLDELIVHMVGADNKLVVAERSQRRAVGTAKVPLRENGPTPSTHQSQSCGSGQH
jgi:low affinity Fe/Cu permease